ncbi:MAG: N-acetyltransferase family protein [Sporolactobacillus sp.]
MTTQILLRDATASDLSAIVAIYNSTIPGRMVTADTTEVTVEERRPWFNDHLADPKRPLWVAVSGSEVCGWLSLSSFYGRPAYLNTVELSVYIDARYRRQGVASLLIREALTRSASYSISTILTFIFGHNKPSLGLFEHFKFEKWGLLPGVASLDGVQRDLVIMGKTLG